MKEKKTNFYTTDAFQNDINFLRILLIEIINNKKLLI